MSHSNNLHYGFLNTVFQTSYFNTPILQNEISQERYYPVTYSNSINSTAQKIPVYTNNNTNDNFAKKNKKVHFDLSKNKVHSTYSRYDYDRHQIESFIYKMSYKRLSHNDVINMYNELNRFKQTEMPVHDLSKHNTKIHKKQLKIASKNSLFFGFF